MITITLNGEPKKVDENTTIASLLASLELNREGIAVAIDHRVVPRSEHASFHLIDGANIEVIRAVGGG